MPDYQQMYYIMCAAASKALDALPGNGAAAAEVLQKAMEEAEEIYIQTCGDTEQ